MGATLSCLDPAREHPPFSWPKDHPGRAEAIAEYKARRSSSKFTKKAAKTEVPKPVAAPADAKHTPAREILPAEPKEVADAKAALAQEVDDIEEVKPDVVEEITGVPVIIVPETKEETVTPAVEEKKEDIAPVEEAPVVAEKAAVAEDAPQDSPEEIAKVENAVAEPIAALPDANGVAAPVVAPEENEKSPAEEVVEDVVEKSAEPPVVTEAPIVEAEEVADEPEAKVEAKVEVEPEVGPEVEPEVEPVAEPVAEPVVEPEAEPEAKVELEAKVEPEVPVEPEAPVEPETNVEMETDLAPEATAEAMVDAAPQIVRASEVRPVSPSIDARRAIFENKPDNIPVVSELAMDIQDPVTGEFVTLTEYRKRQRERAQGVVKEQVDKFEALDEVAMKEMATRKLQDESRQKKVRSWTRPDSSSTPSSPIEPRKMGDLQLPFEEKMATPTG